MFLLYFIDQVAHHDLTIKTDSTIYNIPHKVWEAFLQLILSNFYLVTSFHISITSASRIKPILEQLSLATSN